jgi:hypothetical protein
MNEANDRSLVSGLRRLPGLELDILSMNWKIFRELSPLRRSSFISSLMSHCSKIRQYFRSYNPRSQPDWLVHPEKSSESPDMIIDYQK